MNTTLLSIVTIVIHVLVNVILILANLLQLYTGMYYVKTSTMLQ